MALSESDLEVLGETWAQFGHWNRWDLVDYTHSQCPEWQDPQGSSNPISYHALFTALGYQPEQVAALVARLAEQEHLNSAFA